jgi:hypothetical protein
VRGGLNVVGERLNAMTDVDDGVSGAGEGGVVNVFECLLASE